MFLFEGSSLISSGLDSYGRSDSVPARVVLLPDVFFFPQVESYLTVHRPSRFHVNGTSTRASNVQST